ncbi:MAG TPA: PAS domain S-box protein [Spongiibacteraceae bacterium]|nr:PAS domain S-box protein [Spongiibacteraceae bacterium]
MLIAGPPVHEEQRITLLKALKLLDSPPEEIFDRITRLAAQVLQVPIAVISLIDRDRQWFKSRVGLDVNETPRDYAFCAHAIHSPQPLIVADALQDTRFADNPLVLGDPYIRFYAGRPIFSSSGIALGTLCVIDRKPRALSATEVLLLEDVAALAQREIVQREAAQLSAAISAHSDRAIQESEARFQATFEYAAVGIAMLDVDGHWLKVNRKLCEFLGYREEDLLKLTFADVTHPEDLDADLELVKRIVAGDIAQYSLEKRYLRSDGSIHWANLSVSLQRDHFGKPLYFISVVADIQARKEAETSLQMLKLELEDRVQQRTRQLQETNAMLSEANEQQRRSELSLKASAAQLGAVLETAQDAYLCIDSVGTIKQWNRQAELTFGWSSEEALGRHLDEMIVPVQYRAAHRQGMERFQLTGEARVLNKRLELVAMRRDGSLFPIEIRIAPLPSEHGHLFCAFLHDITERKKIAEALHDSRNQLHTIANNLPVQIAYIDAEQKFRFANEAYRTAFNLAPELIIGHSLAEMLNARVYAGIKPHVEKVLSGQRDDFEIAFPDAGQESIWNVSYIPDVREFAVTGFYVMAQDITTRKALELSLERQATQDALTGLPNRRALLAGLARAVARANRSSEAISILFLDLDGFKAINDRYGHDSGDYLLKQFAQRLLACVRATDIVARLAGDEFVIVLEGLGDGAAEAQAVAAQILSTMSEPIESNGNHLAFGTSIGIYVFQAGGSTDPEQLIALADRAMYEAKRGGKNRIFLASEN